MPTYYARTTTITGIFEQTDVSPFPRSKCSSIVQVNLKPLALIIAHLYTFIMLDPSKLDFVRESNVCLQTLYNNHIFSIFSNSRLAISQNKTSQLKHSSLCSLGIVCCSRFFTNKCDNM